MKKIFLFIILLNILCFHLIAQNHCSGVKYNTIGVFDGAQEQTNFEVSTELGAPPPPLDPDQYRLTYFIHGLGGDINSWLRAANASGFGGFNIAHPDFKPRKLIPLRFTYSTMDINNASTDLASEIFTARGAVISANTASPSPLNITSDRNDNFIIAHSQGGIVSRYLDYKYTMGYIPTGRELGGIATFGTPNKGAFLLDKIPEMISFAGSAAKLLDGPAREQIAKSIPDILYTKPLYTFVLNKYEDVSLLLQNDLIPLIAKDLFKDNLAPITSGYHINSTEILTLNNPQLNASTNTAKAAIYGIENEPVLWRTAQSFKTAANTFDLFDANPDDSLNHFVTDMRNQYQNKIITNQMMYSVAKNYIDNNLCAISNAALIGSLLGLLHSPAGALVGYTVAYYACVQSHQNAMIKHLDIIDGYQNGVDFLDQANDNWKRLIGATVDQTTAHTKCMCDILDETEANNPHIIHVNCNTAYSDYANQILNPMYANMSVINCENVTTFTTVQINKPNDGVVLKESAIGFKGVIPQAIFEMPNSNHMQMRNDNNTKAALLNLYNGQFSNYFYTEEQ